MTFLAGVDDAFLLIHSWERLARHREALTKGAPERLGLVLEDIGPSILITSMTNCLAFSVGALTPTPEIANFCFATALAMLYAFVFEITLFGAFLTMASKCEQGTKRIGEVRELPV